MKLVVICFEEFTVACCENSQVWSGVTWTNVNSVSENLFRVVWNVGAHVIIRTML